MTLTVEATFENGQLKFKEPVVLAEGTTVRVTITPVDDEGDPLAGVIGIGDGPVDGAENHDKYIYTAPTATPAEVEELPPNPDDPLEAVIGICDDGPPVSLAEHHDAFIYGLKKPPSEPGA